MGRKQYLFSKVSAIADGACRLIFNNNHVELSVSNEVAHSEATDDPLYDFLTVSREILTIKGDENKLRLCRFLLPELPAFVSRCFKQDGELPPVVSVRDYMPELLMRFGEWSEAEATVQLCISCGAYGHMEYKNNSSDCWVAETGETELTSITLRRSAAEAAIAYISKNPGTFQNKIYKVPALASVDHDALVWFCRFSHQIKREPEKNANRLYVVDGVLS